MAYAPKAAVNEWRASVAELAAGLPVPFLLGLMDRLSGGDPDFEGRLGGRSLYQIHPNTAQRLDLDPAVLWEPETNIAVAVRLLRDRSAEIQQADPTMASQRPGDLGLLTTASYLWGPGIILPAITPGVTAAEVFAALDPAIGEFAIDVFNRAQAYAPAEPGNAMVPSNGTADPPERSVWQSALWILGFAGVGLGIWFLVKERES